MYNSNLSTFIIVLPQCIWNFSLMDTNLRSRLHSVFSDMCWHTIRTMRSWVDTNLDIKFPFLHGMVFCHLNSLFFQALVLESEYSSDYELKFYSLRIFHIILPVLKNGQNQFDYYTMKSPSHTCMSLKDDEVQF